MANAQKMIQERKAQLGATLSGGGVAIQGGLLLTPNIPPSMAMPVSGCPFPPSFFLIITGLLNYVKPKEGFNK